MSCLNVGFRRALLKIQQNTDQTDLKKEVDAVLTKPGASVKGRKGQFQWCSVSTRAKGDPDGSAFLRRLRRKLARAYELKRLRGTQKEIDPNLLKKVFPHHQGAVNRPELLGPVQSLIST